MTLLTMNLLKRISILKERLFLDLYISIKLVPLPKKIHDICRTTPARRRLFELVKRISRREISKLTRVQGSRLQCPQVIPPFIREHSVSKPFGSVVFLSTDANFLIQRMHRSTSKGGCPSRWTGNTGRGAGFGPGGVGNYMSVSKLEAIIQASNTLTKRGRVPSGRAGREAGGAGAGVSTA